MDIYDYINYGLPRNILVTDDSLWGKKGKFKKNDESDDSAISSAPDLSMIKILPDWERIPSAAVKMSEEEFEEAIAELARTDAKKGTEMRDAAKGMQAGEDKRMKVLMEYISVVSPDRKAAYEKVGGIGYSIYGSDGQELMQRGSDGKWQTAGFTEEELARVSKFYEIYRAAYAEYEAENGAVPSSKTTDKVLAGYNAYNSSYSAYNLWA
jgi:hypothetical protein